MSQPKTVAVLSTGDMGGGIAHVLHESGLDVLTCLEGRSALTALRARESGARALPLDDVVRQADLILSVLVPSESRSLAERVAESMRRTGAKPVFVECNAISPRTVREIETVIAGAGGTFIDAGIIGGPPRPGRSGTRFHCSGPDTFAFEALRDHGLDVRVVGREVGQASGLKMVYAASTKGTTALWTELLTAARALGLGDALLAELRPDANPVARQHIGAVTTMPRRARRWVGEMEEIASTFADLGLTPRILEGAADMFRLVGGTALADQTSREPDPALDEVLDAVGARARERSALDAPAP